MTVNVTRDAINVREKLAELDKPTGIAGEAMLRAETLQEQQALLGVGRRNLIINGAMQVAQRGTSFTPSSASYTLDRWRCAFNNSAPTITQETGSTFGTKRTHLKLVTGATSTYSYVAQCIEDIAQFDGKTITVSFDYKSDNSFNCSFEYHFGSGGSTSLYDKHANLIPASPIVKHTSVTITLDDISSKTIGAANTSHLDVLFNMTANNKTLEITNVQLELGKVATPFEHRSYGEELALCQRYYERLQGTGAYGNYAGFATGFSNGSYGPVLVTMRTPKRANPTFSYGGTFRLLSGSGSTTFGIAADTYIDKSGTGYINLNSFGTNTGTGYAIMVTANDDAGAYFAFDAEL